MAGIPNRSDADEKSERDLTEDIDRYGRPAAAAGLSIQAVVRQGDPSDEIVREANHAAADLIVMGPHSHSRSNSWILGSVTERVLRQAPCPAVVVRPFPGPGTASLRHVVCALDLGETAAATLECAVGLADAIAADLIVAHVETGGAVEGARRRLEALVSRGPLAKAGVRTVLMTGVPHEKILAAAHENGASVVVVGSHGGGIVDRQFLGSTTLHLLRQSECPVMVVPADVTPPRAVAREANAAPACGRRP
jgi:nucleotide-binding universal stress UspA family protein